MTRGATFFLIISRCLPTGPEIGSVVNDDGWEAVKVFSFYMDIIWILSRYRASGYCFFFLFYELVTELKNGVPTLFSAAPRVSALMHTLFPGLTRPEPRCSFFFMCFFCLRGLFFLFPLAGQGRAGSAHLPKLPYRLPCLPCYCTHRAGVHDDPYILRWKRWKRWKRESDAPKNLNSFLLLTSGSSFILIFNLDLPLSSWQPQPPNWSSWSDLIFEPSHPSSSSSSSSFSGKLNNLPSSTEYIFLGLI